MQGLESNEGEKAAQAEIKKEKESNDQRSRSMGPVRNQRIPAPPKLAKFRRKIISKARINQVSKALAGHGTEISKSSRITSLAAEVPQPQELSGSFFEVLGDS